MIGRDQLPELSAFGRAEKKFPLKDSPDFATLVVPNGNGSTPCHRWFKYKEAFSSELLGRILSEVKEEHLPHRPMRMLDPFCGVGTSLLSAQLLDRKIEAIGIECNPFSAFVARTKLGWHSMDAKKIRTRASELLSSSPDGEIKLPSLSSISSGRCITRHMARQIVLMREAIEALPPSIDRDALTLGLASIIEPVSKVRKDGRALRLVKKSRTVFRTLLAERWKEIANDVENLQRACSRPSSASVLLGDGRQPNIQDGSIDLILTSPPYPNNIDYNEVYKLELWFLDFAKNAEEFLSLRRATYRSHPTCTPLVMPGSKIDEEFLDIIKRRPFASLMASVIDRVAEIEEGTSRGRTKVLLGYAYDTWRSLAAHFRTLRSGGKAVYVVGNSLHGGTENPYLVPTDLIYATLAEEVGFKVDEVAIARGLQRRLAGNHFLRDSIVVLGKS